MYHAYSKQGLGYISLNPQVAIDAEAKHLLNVLLNKLKPQIPGLVKEAVKAAVPAAVDQLKPRIPELVGMAVPEIKKQIPVILEAATPAIKKQVAVILDASMPAIKKQIPAILKAAEKPLEEYLTKRLYPNVIKPLAEKELSKLGGQAKTKVSTAALGGGSLLLVGVVAFLAFRKSQRKAQ